MSISPDNLTSRIRKITPGGAVSTLAGSTAGHRDSADGTPLFNLPTGVAVDSSGNVYVADRNNNRIRKITPEGVVTTLAGDGTGAHRDGPVASAQFHRPTGVAVNAAGTVLHVADRINNRIRKIEYK